MGNSRIEQLEKLIEANPENALFFYTLGREYLKARRFAEAIPHLQQAIRLQPEHSAAYRELGSALSGCGKPEEAKEIYTRGIEIAEQQGDIQTAKEMRVFLKRLDQT